MKLEAQVANLELSRRLKELNVKQDAIFYWVNVYPEQSEPKWVVLPTHNTDGYILHIKDDEFSAFTAAELGELLPGLYINVQKVFGHYCSKFIYSEKEIFIDENTEADARAKVLIHLIETGVITP